MVHRDSFYASAECNQFDVSQKFRCGNTFSLFNICATTWVDLWFVADDRWDLSSGGKVLKLKLDFVMALDD